MKQGRLIKNSFVLLVFALLSGCDILRVREVTTTSVLQRGNVDCHWQRVIWESSNIADGCDVTITYRGTADCPARLLYISPTAMAPGHDPGPLNAPPIEGTPGSATEPAGANPVRVKLRKVQTIWLACGESNGERHTNGCSYTIERVNCSRNAEEIELTTRTNSALTNFTAICGAAAKTIWSNGGEARGCNITVRLSGAAHCHATLEYHEAGGAVHNITTPAAADLITLVNVTNVTLRCGNPDDSGGEECTCEIVQMDCPK